MWRSPAVARTAKPQEAQMGVNGFTWVDTDSDLNGFARVKWVLVGVTGFRGV